MSARSRGQRPERAPVPESMAAQGRGHATGSKDDARAVPQTPVVGRRWAGTEG